MRAAFEIASTLSRRSHACWSRECRRLDRHCRNWRNRCTSAAAGEAVDQAAVETARSAVVDILEAGGLAQLGNAQTLGERGIVAFDGLAIDQHRQALVEAEAIAVGQALLLLERLAMPVRVTARDVQNLAHIELAERSNA